MTPPTSAQTVTADLLPCPFCGNAIGRKTGRINPMARCTTDGCVVAAKMSVINLDDPVDVERWNTRADNKRIEAKAEIATLTSSLTAAEARVRELEARLRAITNPSALAGSQAAKMIDPTLGPLTPIAMVVTKGQLQDARAALSQTEEGA